jgi:acyl-CoA reductase-like NAD-dependent aldehyde dehydrogenase
MDESGYYVQPTIVTGCRDTDPLVATEQFGPTVPLLTYADIDDAVARANDSSLGLAASVWGGDPAAAERVARQLEVGTTFVNSHNRYGINPAAPFGGTKQSGFGREYGADGVDAYLQTHALNTPTGSDRGGYPDDDQST